MNLQNLLLRISLLDNLSGPARGMMRNMDTVTQRIQGGFAKVGVGIAGVVGAGYTLDKIIQPAKEMASALGEVASLDVSQQVLDDLNQTALKFSTQYGESAAEFVRSSYDIQSAIAGLSGNELPAFTQASAILAKGTKADTGTITSYVGTMYGIFQKNADAMGKAKWVEQLAGQTATAVQMFKTTGSEMSAAFTTIGAEGQAMGISMSEQIGILGTLQATMSGSEAGTKYRAFLAGVGKAQDELGLKFTDSQGKMLPMIDILNKIKGKFGEIDTVAESDLLQKAFGRKEAVSLIKLLSTNIDGLGGSIAKVGEQTGMQKAIDMANTITDPWDRASKAGDALMIMLGQRMLPLLTPVYDGITAVAGQLMRWTGLFPNLARWIGIGTLGVIGLIAGLAALSIMVGIGTFLMTGWSVAAGAVHGVLFALKFAVLQAIPAIWGFSAALLANPITWIVLGIGALIGLVAAAVIYWDEWTQAVADWAGAWLASTGVFDWVDSVIAGFEQIPQWWDQFKNWIGTLDPFYLLGVGIGLLIVGFEAIPLWWQSFTGWLAGIDPFALLSAGIDGLIVWFEAIPQWWQGFTGWIGTLNPFALLGPGINLLIVLFEAIPQWWSTLKDWLGSLNPFALAAAGITGIIAMLDTIKNWWSGFKSWLGSLNPFAGIGGIFDRVLKGVQSVTGAKIPDIQVGSAASPAISPAPKPVAAPAAISQSRTASTPRGGLMSQITNANSSKSVSVGGITVHNYGNKPVTGQRLADELAMAAG